MQKNYIENHLTYSQLVLRQIKTIQEISAKELRDSSKIVKNLIGEQTIEAEDTRYSFLQSVELFGSLLSPYFTETISNSFDDFCKLYDMELIDAINDEEFKEELREFFKLKNNETISNKIENDDAIKNQANIYFLNYKIKEARRIFRELVKLFKDNDFLTQETYGDSSGNAEDSMDAIDEEESDMDE
jgi:hypothetical protein